MRSAWGPQSAFPRPPNARDAGLGHGTGVWRGWGTTHGSTVCAAAAGVSNGHAHPAVVSRLDWQNRGSRCEISGRAKAEDISSQGRLPAAQKAFPPQGRRHYTSLRYHPHESELELDRSYSGSRIAMVHKRSCKVQDNGGSLKLRVVIDRFSAEVFVNDGEQVMSITFKTDLKAEKISFVADGVVKIDILKYEIR